MKTVSYPKLLSRFKEILKSNSLKFTTQREAILRFCYNSKGHFTPEDLRNKIKEPKIGIATIYRTLALLEIEKIITSISFGVDGKKYEFGIKEHHDHMICDKCRKMIEFTDDKIEERQSVIANNHNFIIKWHILQIHGVCEECNKVAS
ncbi:MAG: transcriptional repressor [Helicobacteraceae bacterium]|jgi:Fur family ferric uptake transcriptional regulator|nr:transcriptional repressor [Helicobacteraceae bacterium]